MKRLSRVFGRGSSEPKVEQVVSVHTNGTSEPNHVAKDAISKPAVAQAAVTGPWIVEERSIDAYRPMRVVVIGSGISGIISSIRLRQRISKLDLCVYEKNADIGGTWLENRYPGCACDIPAHTYQATFEPNKEWSTFYAAAPEIHKYWKHVSAKYGCEKYIKFKHRVVSATWDNDRSKWTLQVRNVSVKNLDSGEVTEDQCDVVVSASGALNEWKWPSIPGLHDFKGKLMHSANWDESYDYSGKRVAVIGNGSSGIQIVPGMLPKVTHLDHYIRGRTWLSPTFAREQVDKRSAELENCSPEQVGATAFFTENMKRRLRKKPELINDLLPTFAPACRRLTPGPGYLEALTDDKVDVISNPIVKIVEDGVVTEDGQHHPTDVIVCATGFDTTFTPRFPIVGKDGVSLAERWEATPENYLSLAVDGFPNYFICLGPNAALGEGNLLLLIEKEIDYITYCLAKMQRDNIRAMSVRKEAVERFTKHCDQYFSRTVFGMECRSWYKGGSLNGRVTALWPGSSLHAMKALAHPRWEDYTYDYVNDNPNGWLGDGWAEDERNKIINVDYLDDDQVDFPTSVIVKQELNGGTNGMTNGVAH
ncbi:flavin-containing monooxygenase [Aspergillus foveolatus]|uniref:flavin-containing monooxygenase n=1 Tax=Aspergillus foveolatus TaxID=210207 RepID=UPI003CCE45BF